MPHHASYSSGYLLKLYHLKYGDVFDVLAPDCRRTEFFRRAIGDYAWAVVTGDYERSEEMEQALADYVANGGRLVLNTTHLTDGLAWARGGEAVRRGASGAAVCTRKSVGRGEVFLFEGHYTAEDLVWLMDGVVASSLLRNMGNNEYKLSARSNGGFDCSALCAAFGGGGHVGAAGATLTGGLRECMELAKSAMEAELRRNA